MSLMLACSEFTLYKEKDMLTDVLSLLNLMFSKVHDQITLKPEPDIHAPMATSNMPIESGVILFCPYVKRNITAVQ